ncbi:MAG: hypothetical protein M3Y68_07850 [Chloroflexota bacterium]|nr:hypothetical protein [Chloroflexota bacterium]
MKVMGRLIPPILILVLLLAPLRPVGAQSTESQFFPETGHSIRGDFLRFYQSVEEPRLLFGYPITEQMTSKDGRTVQYFQRARFELRADLPEGQRVHLSSLGEAIYQPADQLNLNNMAGCEAFPTGYSICFAFLDFFNANGGAEQFGYPISPFEFHANLIVQYFERARFEWRADRPEGQRVVLSDLGRIYFDQVGENPVHLRPITPVDATISAVLSLRVRAFVGNSVTRPSGQQTVFVIVRSQTGQSVSNATGKVLIQLPEGGTEEYFFTTNSSGLGTVTFNFSDQQRGEMVLIDVFVAYQGLAAATRTSFRIWF